MRTHGSGQMRLTSKGNPGHALHGTGNGEDHGNDHANHTEDDGAGAMVGDGVHHDPEGQEMAAHDEDAEEELAQAEKFTAERAHQDFSRIGQVLNVGIAFSEQSNVVTGVGRQDSETNDEDDGPERRELAGGKGCIHVPG